MELEITKDEKVTKHTQKVIDAYEQRHTKYYEWIKNIVTLAIGFLGIIVSLKSDKLQSFNQYVLFLMTISALATGIVAGVLVLYNEIDWLNKKRKFEQENLRRILDDEEIIKLQLINRRKIFDVCEYVCIIAFIISIISIVIYSTLSEHKPIDIPSKKIECKQ